MSSYFFLDDSRAALNCSVVVTLLALMVFGWIKGNFTGTRPFRSALQTTLVGGLAASAAFLLARLFA
jgi:VIT1/CCC1 family predicted Fe2+/Mn2+ transporter